HLALVRADVRDALPPALGVRVEALGGDLDPRAVFGAGAGGRRRELGRGSDLAVEQRDGPVTGDDELVPGQGALRLGGLRVEEPLERGAEARLVLLARELLGRAGRRKVRPEHELAAGLVEAVAARERARGADDLLVDRLPGR